jgi:hypothetical protein
MADDDPDALARLVHETRHRARAGLDRPFIPEEWEDRPDVLRDVDGAIAAAVAAAERERLRTHEHEWTHCPECKQPGQPCPCSGGLCCEMERREIAAGLDGARDERERIASSLQTMSTRLNVEATSLRNRGSSDGPPMSHRARGWEEAARYVREGAS